MLVPRPVGWGGGAPGFWQYDRRREAAAGAAALVSRQWNPTPNVAENNNNMTIRRIYNKAIYFFEMPVLFETGESNTYVYDSGGLHRRNTFRTEGKGRTMTITLADGKLVPCIATRV